MFRSLLHQALFTVAKSRDDIYEIDQLIGVCREYLLGLALETTRKEIGSGDAKRSLEIAAYFTHCELETVHLQLAIRLAMVQSFKLKNYDTAMRFAQRLLEQGPAPKVAESVLLINLGT